MINNQTRFPVLTFFIFLTALTAVLPVQAQRRDYMTESEIEVVREAQDINLRVDVLTKMIDRRLTLLGIDSGGWKEPAKASELWGPAPGGTRIQLLFDVRSLLEKAIDDIDDVAQHNENAQTQNKVQGELFPKAVRQLAAAADRYRRVLEPVAEKTTDEKERGILLAALEMCGQISEAAAKLPPEKKKGKT